ARSNFALNASDKQIASCKHEGIQADVFDWLVTAERRSFDLVILDPPSLAKRELEREGAIGAYERLIHNGIQRVRTGGTLLAASCSAHVSAEEFFTAARRAVLRARRNFTEITTTLHAPDHPATFPEAHYLKAIYFKFEPR
ncbi:MAG TPA: hypothetical protein VK968_01715, partial [Roseimicrobium sp.]|nr:hypothetical protein [Roseimicrobium sp.]